MRRIQQKNHTVDIRTATNDCADQLLINTTTTTTTTHQQQPQQQRNYPIRRLRTLRMCQKGYSKKQQHRVTAEPGSTFSSRQGREYTKTKQPKYAPRVHEKQMFFVRPDISPVWRLLFLNLVLGNKCRVVFSCFRVLSHVHVNVSDETEIKVHWHPPPTLPPSLSPTLKRL